MKWKISGICFLLIYNLFRTVAASNETFFLYFSYILSL